MNKMSNKKIKGLFISCIVVIILELCSIGYISLRLYKQSKRIEELENKLYENNFEWSDDGFNYFAIGNSITKHGLANYWWDDDRGMAASKDEADYVHLVTQYLKNNNHDVVTNAYNFSAWEVNYADRAEFLGLLDVYLCSKIDLVTIQLGENASDLSTWESDFEELITYIHNKAPNANIIVVGDFWSNGERDSSKQQAAKMCDVKYVSLDGIKDNHDYYAGLGTLIEDAYGEMHSIEHDGVAIHPGDKGMKAIAEKIIEVLNK